MSENSTTQCLLFPKIFHKPTVMQFDQRQGSSDGGALLLKAADRRYGLIDKPGDRRNVYPPVTYRHGNVPSVTGFGFGPL